MNSEADRKMESDTETKGGPQIERSFAEWLERNNLSQFKDAFKTTGYDTVEVLVEALESQEEVHQAFRETVPLQGNRAKIWVAIKKEQKLKKLTDTSSNSRHSQQSLHDQQRETVCPWKNKNLGWIPYPKHEDTKFFNQVLEAMYKEAWKDVPFADSFRKRFDVEKMRLWKIERGIRKIDGALETIWNSSNPASCHKFRNSTYIFVPNDLAVVNFCMDKLSKNEQIMSELRKELLEHNNSPFSHSNALKHKWFSFSNKQNEDYLSKLGELASKSTSYQEELTSVANKLKLTFQGIEKNNREKSSSLRGKMPKNPNSVNWKGT